MRLSLIVDPRNRYRNKLFFGDQVIATGNNGLEDVQLVTQGKRLMAVIRLSDFDLVVVSEGIVCPEADRFHQIEQVLGDGLKLRGLGIECDMLRQSSNACDGCPKRPKTNSRQN